MIRNILFILLFVALGPAIAQTPPESVDLEAVVKLAREASPRLALERQSVAMAEADRRTAGAYPNPTLSYGRQRQRGEQTQFNGKWAQGASVEIPLLIAGQRGVRVDAADRGIEAARARVSASGNDLAADAGAAYIGLLAAQEKRAILSTSLDELSRMRKIIAGRFESGMASQYDLIRMDVEVESWRTRAAEAEADLADKQGQLGALLGYPGWRPKAVGQLKSLGHSGKSAMSENPTLVAAIREEEAARAMVEVARRERFPSFSVNAGRTWTSDPFGSANSLGVTVEVPILDTRGGAVDRSRAEAQSATLRRQLAQAEVESDMARYEAQVRHRSAALEQFQLRLASRLPDMKQMAEDAYRLGKGSILELLDANRTRYETLLGQIELLANLMAADLRLQAVQGAFALKGH